MSIFKRVLSNEPLSQDEAVECMDQIISGRLNSSQIAGVLCVLHSRRIMSPELAGFRSSALAAAIRLQSSHEIIFDICGSGGDGKDSFNISTLAAFLIAGLGIRTAKHGNYAFTSSCGSSNLMEALKIQFPKTQEEVTSFLEECGFAYLHAPLFHPAFKSLQTVRKELGVRTLFNILGPLLNPIQPTHSLVGTPSLEMVSLYSAWARTQPDHYTFLCADDGYDEISLTSTVTLVVEGETKKLEPADFGLTAVDAQDLKGAGNSQQCAQEAYQLLQNQGDPSKRQVIIANAAAALYSIDRRISLIDCVARAAEALQSGAAFTVLKKLQIFSKS